MVGFFKKMFAGSQVVAEPENLNLPQEIETTTPGLVLKKSQGTEKVEINIVGESFRAANVKAVAVAAEGKEFDIYLINEPTNQHDRNACAVFAANLQVGYIGKPDNKVWAKRVNEATEKRELLWGRARAISREGTANTGIFGYILMPRSGKDIEDLIPNKMTDAALQKAYAKVIDLANSSSEPESLAQLKSLAKKGVTAASPLAAHSLWVADNPDGQDVEQWQEIQDLCDDVLDIASEAAYAADAYDVDVLGAIENLAQEIQKLRT